MITDPDGGLSGRRVFAERLGPDGICLDAEGAVWIGTLGYSVVAAGEVEVGAVDVAVAARVHDDLVPAGPAARAAERARHRHQAQCSGNDEGKAEPEDFPGAFDEAVGFAVAGPGLLRVPGAASHGSGRGLANGEIARALYISEVTVKAHLGHVLTKLGLRDRAAAIVYGFDTGLVAPGG